MGIINASISSPHKPLNQRIGNVFRSDYTTSCAKAALPSYRPLWKVEASPELPARIWCTAWESARGLIFLGGNCAARAVIQICTGSRATYGLNRSVARQNASEDYHVCSVYGCHVSLMLDVFLTGMLRVDHSLHVSFFRTKSTLRLVLCLLNSSWLLESTNGVLTKTLNSLVGNASTETATE